MATEPARRSRLRTIVTVGAVAAVLSIVADWGIVRAVYGHRYAGHAALHIRFGPSSDHQPAKESLRRNLVIALPGASISVQIAFVSVLDTRH